MLHLAQTVWPRFGGDQTNCALSPISGPHTTPIWRKISLPVHHSVRSPDRETISGVIVAPDGTLRICHAGMLSAVTFNGTILWQLDLGDVMPEDERFVYSLPTALQTGETLLVLPDALLIVDRLGNIQGKVNKLPTLNREQIAAVGSTDGFSAFVRSDGTQIGEYNHSATFAEYIDGGWIALSKQRLARLTTEGKEVWGCEISRTTNLIFVEQPLVDRDGFIFVRHQEGYLCCDAYGHVAFNVQLSAPPQGLMSIIAPGVTAYVMESELFIGQS
ncbi:hypothetical protein [Dictyobacter formicarum]|uniref:Uncharacterized protein n=1 Tax=Dictyobacter formicarum TaxID=2778368 RepID=A0ABQ3VCV2_9CHLR|nr:hypothetical protein [Dictyobacter formicarum]GHO83223.1 hypothetical protein KSZ_12290 [Dictyobacter formicarum]